MQRVLKLICIVFGMLKIIITTIAVTNSSKVISFYIRNKNDDRCIIDTKI